MKQEAKVYNIIKNIKDDEKKQISIIELDQKKYILKNIKHFDVNLINMLKNEVNQLKVLEDTNIAPKVISYKFNESLNYIIMEVIKGKSINRLNLDNIQIIKLMIKIIDVVNIIHDKGIVHGDLKPANILIDVTNNIKLIDFEISVYNRKNYFKGYGSRHYCSINHLTTGNITELDDLYSLGIIFYELMLNKLPFDGTVEEIKNKKMNGLYVKSNDDKLNNILEKLFNLTSQNKYKTLNEFKYDLIELLKN